MLALLASKHSKCLLLFLEYRVLPFPGISVVFLFRLVDYWLAMRVFFRVATAVLLLISLFWFSIHLNVLPTREAFLEHVLPVTEVTKTSEESTNESLSTTTVAHFEQNVPFQSHETPAVPIAESVLDSATAVSSKPTESAKIKSPAVELLEALEEAFNPEKPNLHAGPPGDRIVVVGRLQSEDTNWLAEELPEYVEICQETMTRQKLTEPLCSWQHAVYTVDNTSMPLHTAQNKGREANVYLTYIIENYHDMPSTIAFVHSHLKG